MSQSTAEIWTIILLLGLGTFLIRFSFLALSGRRTWPPLLLRLLRYTPVAVRPGMVTPLVLWPEATGGALDLPRLSAAVATLALGLWLKSAIAAIFGGAGMLALLLWLGV